MDYLINRFRILYTVLYISSQLHAFPQYQSYIPNGNNVPNPCRLDTLWSGVGHVNPKGGLRRNQFGIDFVNFGKTWSRKLCRADSDGDGLTNGEELGDPDCEWRKEQDSELQRIILRNSTISHPGICEPTSSERCKRLNDWLKCEKESSLQCDALKNEDTKYFDIKFPRRHVPSKKTTYMCMIVDVPEGDNHMVANTPLIDNEHIMHHMLLYGCSGETFNRKSNTPFECEMDADNKCKDLLGLWSPNMKGECMHKDAGFRLGVNGYQKLALQMHWNNKDERSDYHDGSGMRIYYTRNLRQYDAGTLWVGQIFLEIPPNRPEVTVSATCSSDCTSKIFKDDISVIGAINHMHHLGQSQSVTHYRNGTRIGTITNDMLYSYDSPNAVSFVDPVIIKPGDELKTTCSFNSKEIPKTTFFGRGTHDEMCFAFLKYYPKRKAHASYCLSFKELPMCKTLRETRSLFPEGLNGCHVQDFASITNPETLAMVFQIQSKCRPDICTTECKETIKKIRRHPCLHNDVWEYMKFFMMQNKESMMGLEVGKLLAVYTSCDLQLGFESAMASNIHSFENHTLTENTKPIKPPHIKDTQHTMTDACPKCPSKHLCHRNAATSGYSLSSVVVTAALSFICYYSSKVLLLTFF